MRSMLRAAMALGIAAVVTLSGAHAEPAADQDKAQAQMVAQESEPYLVAQSGSAYTRPDYKTLTNVPTDTNWTDKATWERPVQTIYVYDGGDVTAWSSTDTYQMNRRGAMGADVEYMRDDLDARFGVWANGRIANQAPRSVVNSMVRRMKDITGGEWTSAKKVDIAGVPAYHAHGTDVFGNYHYEVYAVKRWGNTYAFATRTFHSNRWNKQLADEVNYFITHIHPTNWNE